MDCADTLTERIAKILSTVERYNVENLTMLEEYVEYQASHRVYNVEANLAVLKLYQFFPHVYKPAVAHLILAKSLTGLPCNDFNLCLCLLGSLQFDDITIQYLTKCSSLLETCQFRQFWKLARKKDDVFQKALGFKDDIRKYISGIVDITYQRIERNFLRQIMGVIHEDELAELIKLNSWISEGTNHVRVSNLEIIGRNTNIEEKINLKSLFPVMFSENKVKLADKNSFNSSIPSGSVNLSESSSDKASLFDPNIDPNDYETMIKADSWRKPSKETECHWLYARCKQPCPKSTEDGGKWLIFEKLDKIDDTWDVIRRAVERGSLGQAAKVSTIKDKEIRSPYQNEAVICVYTYDSTDDFDVMRVRNELRNMGFRRKLGYKTDKTTLEGKYRWNTGTRVTKFYL